jgi:cation diffusion facilitator family transporter
VKNNFQKVKKVLIIILLANLLVAIVKIIMGSIIKSSSMTADGLHSLTDGSSNIVGLIGIKLASKPIDNEHPYGHNKFETLSGLFIAIMLFVVGGNVIKNAIYKFMNPVTLEITMYSLIALMLTLIINIFVSVTEFKKGKELKSQILVSDSIHTRSDIYVSIGVLVTLVCVKFGLPSMIDSIASLIVSVLILHAGYEIFKENSNVLVDKAAVDTKKIKDLVMSYSLVKDTYNIRSRGGQNSLFIDLHLLVEPKLSIEESHWLVHNIENEIKEKVNESAQVIAHLEPYHPDHIKERYKY